jgi:hypothetical protein
MVKLGQSSFRRILLSRILLLSVPVLLVGEYVTYRKARSTLLETARQNLTESAVRKAETIEQWAKSLKSNLIGASESSMLQSVDPKDYQKFIAQLGQRLPAQVDCLQLTEFTDKSSDSKHLRAAADSVAARKILAASTAAANAAGRQERLHQSVVASPATGESKRPKCGFGC